MSCCRDVISVLEDWGTERRETEITKITVTGAGVESVNGDYRPVAGDRHIPPGFSSVCGQQGWDTAAMWTQLSGGSTWYRADNEAYIYWNTGDSCWWIDKVRLSWTLCFSVLLEYD